jgi:hypothetical protein
MRRNVSRSIPTLSRHFTGLGLLSGALAGCPLPESGDMPKGENGTAAATDGEDGSSTGGMADETGHTETGSDDVDETTGAMGEGCDPGCEDHEVCHDSLCHPAAYSLAIGGGTDRQTVWDVATDPAGNIAIIGDFARNLDLGGELHESKGSGRDVFVALLNPIGEVAWGRTFGSPEVVHQDAKGIAFDSSGEIVIVGEMRDVVDFGTGPLQSAGQTDIFVVKLDPAGETMWARRFGGDSFQRVSGVAIDAEGSIALAGDTNGTFDLGGPTLENAFGTPNLWVAKLDRDGEHVWSVTSGDGQNQHVRGVAVDADGHVVVCGEFRGTIDLGAGPVTGNLFDVFVARFHPDGELDWALVNGDGGDEQCGSVAVDAAGNIGIEGRFEGPLSFGDLQATNGNAEKFAASFDASGSLRWSRSFGAGHNETGPDRGSVAFDGQGNMILAGGANIPIDFGGDLLVPSITSIYLAKLDPGGAHIWSQMYGDQNRQLALAVTVDAAHRIVMAGEFTGSVDFGFGAHSVQANMDAFVARLLP